MGNKKIGISDINIYVPPGKLELDSLIRKRSEDNPKLAGELTHWHYDTWQIQWSEPHAWFDFGTLQFLLDNDRKEVLELQFDVPNGDIFFHEIHARRRE